MACSTSEIGIGNTIDTINADLGQVFLKSQNPVTTMRKIYDTSDEGTKRSVAENNQTTSKMESPYINLC